MALKGSAKTSSKSSTICLPLQGDAGRGGEPKGSTFTCMAANGSLPQRWPLCHALAYLQSEMD